MNDFFLADDLSGALDAAAAFHRVGRRVRVAVTAEAWGDAQSGEILAITTETRNMPAASAAEVVAGVMRQATARGGRLLYKKVDSTLRGAVAAELRAVMAALPRHRVLFAPANPRVGRTVVGGVLLVDGVPVAATEFGRDPSSPVRESELRRLLAGIAGVEIPEVATEADFVAAIRWMKASGEEWIPVGSGGLAMAVAEEVRSPSPSATVTPVVPASPVLFVAGSAHPRNRLQAAELERTRGIPVIVIPPGAEPESGCAAAIGAALRDRGGATLALPEERIEPRRALDAIASTAAALVRTGGVRRVFATGGDTAFAVASRLGIRSLVYAEEIEPGLGLAFGPSAAGPVWFAIKPGGFGHESTWTRVWDRLLRT